MGRRMRFVPRLTLYDFKRRYQAAKEQHAHLPLAWLRRQVRVPPDPSRAGLRRAARAAIVMPAAFIFAQLVIGNAQVTTFVAFGCFALLVLADIGGRRRPRALAYAVMTAVGAVLIVLGTLASFQPWVGAVAMLLVAFVVSFASVFGGYTAAAQTALLLAFVLAVSIPVPSPSAALAPRVAGWLLAGAVSLLAGVFLWPRFEREALRQQAAVACRAVGRLIQTQRSQHTDADVEEAQRAAEEAVTVAREAYAATPHRPAGPAQRDRAFVELLSELEQILAYIMRSVPAHRRLPPGHPCLREGNRLVTAVAHTLEASAHVLTGGTPPDLLGLQAAWRTHRQALDRWAADALRAGSSPEEVLDGLMADDALRVVAYLVLALGANASLAVGVSVETTVLIPPEIPRRGGVVGLVLRVGQTIRAHLVPTSVTLHNSLRVAVALALAVLVARLLQLDHAFWVVLGTLTALRSNALATGRTTVQAIVGTLAGFAIGAVFLVLVGTLSAVLWVFLPVSVFFAAYAASTIGFVAGQAAFTVVVLILFNLIAPVGWQLGVARLEDVTVGVGISLVVGVLLWPRGVRGAVRTSLAALYRAIAGLLADTFGRILEAGTTGASTRILQAALRANDRAREALEQYLRERSAKPLAPEVVALLVAGGSRAVLAADVLDEMAGADYRPQSSYTEDTAHTAMLGQVQALVTMYGQLADRLEGTFVVTSDTMGHEAHISESEVRGAALSSLQRWKADPGAGRAAIAVVVAGEWIQHLGALAAALEAPVAATLAAARVPWWQ